MQNLCTIMPAVEDRIVDEAARLAFQDWPEPIPMDLIYDDCGGSWSNCEADFVLIVRT